ncbi:MAG: GGDEF domain-containing protein [Sulfuriferula sp.]
METEHLRRQLNLLLAKARENEEKLLRFERFEQQLMTTRTLMQLIIIMLQDFPVNFELDVVNLVLLDREGEWARALGREGVLSLGAMGLILSHDLIEFAQFYPQPFRPHLASYQANYHLSLFDGTVVPLGSIALLPLVRQGRLMGGLHLASRDKQRFVTHDGTYFLERLSAFFVMCLENALIYDKLERFGLMDALTQVNNRHYFNLRLKEAVNHALRYRQPLVAMMFDLDHFKVVNDRWGHQIGDYILQQVVQVIQALLRGSDTFARYGGEEFVALLPGTDKAVAIDIAERIRLAIANYRFSVGEPELIHLSVSIGVAQIILTDMYGSEERSAQELVAAADTALYSAKAQGRNRVECSP